MTYSRTPNSQQPPRTCSNCAAFNAAPAKDESRCWNLVEIEDGSIISCSEHKTHQKDATETAHTNANRDAINRHLQALASSDEETEHLMKKLRRRLI